MIMRKGQISMNTIVYVAIALLVLVLIVSVTTGSFGNIASKLTKVTPDDLEIVKTRCTTMCDNAKISITSSGANAFANSQYCSRTFPIDTNGDGNIAESEVLPCYSTAINVQCQAVSTTADGTSFILNPTDEDYGCPALD